jgi:GDP-4-dehydro-6-deoxy-D-mannose reductase
MRVLVTGADGFVGGHLCRLLREAGDEVVVWHGPRESHESGTPRMGSGERVVDVRDAKAVNDAVAAARPDAIVHLAAVSSVAVSHAEPVVTFDVNTMGTLHLCVAARALAPSPRVLFVSSGEVYGPTAPGERAAESAPLAPVNPYAASKVAAEVIGFQFARSYGLDFLCARPFAHVGTGQAPIFAIPSFARQVADARRRGEARGTILVGNLEPVRDFSDVRDVVAAYRLLLQRGARGEAYNVCSGEVRSIRGVLDDLIELGGTVIDIRVDPSRLRPSDLPNLVGDASKLRSLGWSPTFALRDALRDILAAMEGGL